MATELYELGFTQNRELSWLKFNARVLGEAMDETVPLLERLKFISIFTSNLDEFFMIRVGSLFDLNALKAPPVDNKSGMTPMEQLEKIYAEVRPLYKMRERVFFRLEGQLRDYGLYHLSPEELSSSEQKFVKQYFKSDILPILSPQIIDTHHPFPHLQNKVVHIGAKVKHKNKELFAIIPVPLSLPEIVFLPGEELRFVRTEDIISRHLEQIFSIYTVLEQTCFCVTRNADVNPDDDLFEGDSDFRKKMKRLIEKRKRLAPVRLEVGAHISQEFLEYLCKYLTVTPDQVYSTKAPFSMGYAFALPGKLDEEAKKFLTYTPFSPQPSADVNLKDSILKQVQKKDLLLSYPFESMDPFLQMIKEASRDPQVISIKITIYRLAGKAKLVEYLSAAAENGKDVTVLIELRARFDEKNNIDWSERLEEAGCNIIYGFEDYKVHSKICLITRREKGEIKYITQVGTGNYNEKTAELYTDLSLITASQEIGRDADEFFKNMSIGNLEGRYDHLLVAPFSLKSVILGHMDREIKKKEGGRILFKLNSLTDADILKKLQDASNAGVEVTLIIRGICCLLPGIPGKTENVKVFSIVGRYLEHSRIYCFGKPAPSLPSPEGEVKGDCVGEGGEIYGDEELMYIASADFMTRNTQRRVEVACPIYCPAAKKKIRDLLELQIADNVKGRVLLSDGTYEKKSQSGPLVNSQEALMALAAEAAKLPEPPEEPGQFKKAWLKFKKLSRH